MRLLIQRVLQASVTVDSMVTGSIEKGLLVLVGIEDADDTQDVEWLSNKVVHLRIFDDDNKIPNLSVKDIDGDILVVSQFTLHASTKKGNRPSYLKASTAAVAVPLYEMLVAQVSTILGKKVQTGAFGADMKVALVNDGPVTIWMDSKNKQ